MSRPTETRVTLDHLGIVVSDLPGAVEAIFETYGLNAVEGGRHPGHGTSNYIVPLGPNYLELLTVVDPAEAATSVFGRWAIEHQDAPGVHIVCLRTEALGGICSELGIASTTMSRTKPDGSEISWMIAGLGETLQTEGLPFFIQWPSTPDQPGRTRIQHRVETDGLTSITVAGSSTVLEERVMDASAVSIVHGRPGITDVELDVNGESVQFTWDGR